MFATTGFGPVRYDRSSTASALLIDAVLGKLVCGIYFYLRSCVINLMLYHYLVLQTGRQIEPVYVDVLFP